MWQQELRDIEQEKRLFNGEATFGEWCIVALIALFVLSPVFACLFLTYVL
jgi:hypothetical protein